VEGLGEKYQLWGTFSVWDHVRPGAFLAEVVMYDTLVVPVPPNPETAEPGEDRAFAEDQWERWEKAGWQPERLLKLLEIIRPGAEPIEWDRKRHERWKAEYDKYHAGRAQAANLVGTILAGWLTGQELLSVVPAKAAGAVAVLPFDSLEKLKEELQITETTDLAQRQEASRGLPGNLVSAVVGRDFLVPDDPDRDEFYLLRDAVDLVQQEDWRAARQAFHAGMLKFVDSGRTDYDSIRSAVAAMAGDLETLDKLARSRRIWNGTRRVLFFTQIATQAASAPVNPLAVGQLAVSVGQFTTSEVLGNPADPGRAGPAGALLLDAQRKLGLTLEGERRPPRLARIRRWFGR
jgi:hypothetical protein